MHTHACLMFAQTWCDFSNVVCSNMGCAVVLHSILPPPTMAGSPEAAPWQRPSLLNAKSFNPTL